MKSITEYDYIVIIAYFLFMLAIGFYFMRVNKSAKEFFAGGNMLPWWVSGVSLYMTNFSAWIFTGGAGFAYNVGWFALLYFGAGSLAYLVGTLLTGALWRRSRTMSPVEYTQTRFNVTTQQFFGWVISVNFILSAGVQLAATSKLLAPVLQLDFTVVAVLIGTVILAYSIMGGLWAVTVTDTLQGIIVLVIAFVVVPASLHLVGGFDALAAALPSLSFDHTYNNFHYDTHWLISIFMISSIGFAAGGAQRFFSVQDEKAARKVGYLAAGLAALGPLVFGVPPLVAKVLWPDLSAVEFFKPYLGQNPQDLVYFGVCLQILPNGLVGVFVAAMLAATMSTLSSVYNLVSSIYSRDVYKALIRPDVSEEHLLKIGRNSSLVSGLIVIGLAVIFLNSKLGIFNLMQAFFTLFNTPVVIPIAFGLILRKIPTWSGFAAICWGLLIGVTTRYLLDWSIGPQVYLAFTLTFGVFALSPYIGDLYRASRGRLAALAAGVAVMAGVLFVLTRDVPQWIVDTAGEYADMTATALAVISAGVLGWSLFPFGRLFANETAAHRALVEEFFRRLDTPIDLAKEVFTAGRKQVSTFPLIGGTMVVMGLLSCLIFLTDLPEGEGTIVATLATMLVAFGGAMWYFGQRTERRFAMAREAALTPDAPAGTAE